MDCSTRENAPTIQDLTEVITQLNCRSIPAERKTHTTAMYGERHGSDCCMSELALVSLSDSSTLEVQSTLESDEYAMQRTPPDRLNTIERLLRQHGGSSTERPVWHWRVDEHGQLVPRSKIRQHFDRLLLALGDATLDEVEAVMRAQAREELSESGVAQAMDLWRRYIVLGQLPTPAGLTSEDPSNRCCTLNYVSIARTATLGTEWAKAFYSTEEAALRSHAYCQPRAATMQHLSLQTDPKYPSQQRNNGNIRAAHLTHP